MDADVAVQVRGFVDYTNTALGPAIDPDTGLKRAELIVDTNNDGIVDKVKLITDKQSSVNVLLEEWGSVKEGLDYLANRNSSLLDFLQNIS